MDRPLGQCLGPRNSPFGYFVSSGREPIKIAAPRVANGSGSHKIPWSTSRNLIQPRKPSLDRTYPTRIPSNHNRDCNTAAMIANGPGTRTRLVGTMIRAVAKTVECLANWNTGFLIEYRLVWNDGMLDSNQMHQSECFDEPAHRSI